MGNFTLDGSLDVSLYGGFTLADAQQFLIVDIDGIQTGMFDDLGEGGLVGNFGGTDLFITYGAGDGNDVVLFTSVPAPGTVGLMGLLMMGLLVKRRRRQAFGFSAGSRL